jgi:Flp pilus assembly pilin Flp
MRIIRSFIYGDEAVTAIEYSLIAALIAVAIAGSLPTIAGVLDATFGTVVAAF